ncbi:MAG: ribose 5-phosphate isomerase B [Planctomycetota bacterium]
MQEALSPGGVIGVGADHAGVALKNRVMEHLRGRGLAVQNFGVDSAAPCDYPALAFRLAEAVARGEVARGILVCGTGVGMSIAANKVKGIRAALCTNVRTAVFSRTHNDANILVLSGREETAEEPIAIVDAWVETVFSREERHVRRIAQIADYEAAHGRASPHGTRL